jgi:hypothetical protein
MAANNDVSVRIESRLLHTRVFQRQDGTTFWDIWNRITFEPREDDTFYVIQDPNEGMRIDLIAHKVYQNVNYWWVICEANNILNPFTDLTNREAAAHTNPVYSPHNLVCFKATALKPGARYNTGDIEGIHLVTNPTQLEVYVKGVLAETFDELSPYPNLVDGTDNPNFWGYVSSRYVSIEWLSPYTVQPEIGGAVAGPQPPAGRIYNLSGGVDNTRLTLRIPSLAHVNEKLSS